MDWNYVLHHIIFQPSYAENTFFFSRFLIYIWIIVKFKKSRSVSSWKVIMTRQGQGMGSKGSIKEAEYFLFINLYWSLIWFKLSTTRQGRQFYVEINNTGCQLTDWLVQLQHHQPSSYLSVQRADGSSEMRSSQAGHILSFPTWDSQSFIFKKIISKRLNWQIISEELRHSRIVIACPISFCQLVKEGNH